MKDLGKKKLIIIAGGIIALVVLIVIILLVYNAIFGKTSYKDIETKVVNAAKEYYGDHTELLPKNENEEVSTTDAALTQAGYLKSMSELTKKMKDVTCTATVMVNYAGGEYRYTPLLNCGDSYSTKTLVSYIENNETKVLTGQGLYDLNGELVYRGENPNNYIKFANKMWRIVKIENGKAVLILNDKNTRVVWDDRFNADRDRNDGINEYSVSRIRESLNTLYEDKTLFTDGTKNLLSIHTLYVGKRAETDNVNDGSIEKSQVIENQYIGLLPLYDYINASIDGNCTTAITDSCSNYNYLSIYNYSWWTLTADASNTYKTYRVSSTGTVSASRAASNGYIRPVIHLAKDALYISGNGTAENPYIIK